MVKWLLIFKGANFCVQIINFEIKLIILILHFNPLKLNKDLKEFKYSDLFQKYNIEVECPCNQSSEISVTAYRFALSPLQHDLNFLPNILYGERKPNPNPIRVNATTDKKSVCGNCALSFFTDKDIAKKTFLSFGEPAMAKIGYTHIAEGKIEENHGVSGPIKKKHFNFFEYHETDLRNVFTLIGPIKD